MQAFNNLYFKYSIYVTVLTLFIFAFLRILFPSEKITDIFQATGVILVSLGIIYAAVQAGVSSNTYKHANTPILLHVGFFDFFDSDNRPHVLTTAPFKNVGERVCFNIRGWCITNNNFYPLIFGEHEERDGSNGFRGDYKYTWAEKGNTVYTTIMKPSTKRVEGAVDHIILFYEDNEGKIYYSLMTRHYEYSTGFLNIKKIQKVTNINKKVIKELIISVKNS